jgi:hypothetical protein
MPITTEILCKLSVNTSPGNSTAQANPNNSLGGYMSSTQLTAATLNNLFDDVTGDENAASEAEYRCIFFHNSHGSLALESPKIWIQSETASGANTAIALAGQGVVSATQAGTPQADVIADENTAPSGEVFSSPTTKTGGLSPGNIAAGSTIGVWVRRTAANTGALALDGAVIRIEGDTQA